MTWSNLTKYASTITNGVKQFLISYLKNEDDTYLLLESGGKIVLEDNSFTNKTKY